MEQLIQITATYSNAILLCVISNVSDFAKKLDLPVQQPVMVEHVDRFQFYPTKRIDGSVTLTNGYKFWQNHGYVSLFYAPSNYYVHPVEWRLPEEGYRFTNFWGVMSMSTNEVVEFARNQLRKLGYDPKTLHADGPPTLFDGPYEFNGRTIPYCDVEWRNKKDVVRISLNAETKQIVRFSLVSTNAWRPDPDVGVEPGTTMPKAKMFIRTNAPPRVSR